MYMVGKYIDPFTDFGFKRIFGNEKHKNIKEAFDVASFLALSKDEQFAYQMDMKAKNDYKNTLDTALETGREEGRKQGLKEGEKKAKIEIAKNLLDILDNKTIAKKTDLTIEEIEQLRK